MRRAKAAAAFLACGLLVADCATEGTATVGVGIYDNFYYDDWWWYGAGGCCVDYPGDIGPPPHPEHPIAKPPLQPTHPIANPPTPSQPIATPPARPSAPASRPMPSPRPSMGGGGGRRR